MLLIFVMLFNILSPMISFAVNEMDYREYVYTLRMEHEYFDTPVANFDLYVNGNYVGSTNVGKNSSFVENLSNLSSSGVKIKVGDKIAIKDRSSVGSGNRISLYDLQVAQGVAGNTSSKFNGYANIDQIITAEIPGEMVIFLNVADNYSKIPRFDNYSQYGNWRTEVIKPSGNPNTQIKGWYFTAFKLTVEDTSKPKPEFDIYYQGQDKTDNYANSVEVDNYPATVSLIDRSTTEKGTIVDYTWERKLPDGSWKYVNNTKNPTTTVSENKETFRLRVANSDGKWSDWVEHSFYSKLKGDQEPPAGDIRAVLDGPSMAEWGDNIRLDSSRSTTTSTITKREYWRKTSRQNDWTPQTSWQNEIKPYEKTIENGNASYIDYKLKIYDSNGRTAEAIHRVNMVEAVDPAISASLLFDSRQGFQPVKISLDDYLNDNEIEVSYWLTAEYSSAVKTTLGHFYFFQNIDDSVIRKYEDNERNALNDPNFIDYVRINTGTNPDSITDAAAYGTFKVRPSNPVIKAALLLKSNMVNLEPDFATAYHTVQFEIDAEPPVTKITVPEPFYPKKVNIPENKTVTWDYYSEDNIPYEHSIVSLYKIDGENFYTIFENKVQKERKLVIEGDAGDQYEIYVEVVDKINQHSRLESEIINVINAVPIIDLELDTSVENVLGIEVFNKTPKEIEELFPTSYTTWEIQDAEGNALIQGEGEAPKKVDLDQRFEIGKFKVIQRAVNTIGATAQAHKYFEIESRLDFLIIPSTLYEGQLAKINDLSRAVYDKVWEIKRWGTTDYDYENLILDNGEFTRDYGRYDVKLKGKGYVSGEGMTELFRVREVNFLDATPKAAFNISGNLKMYKEIVFDGSLSEKITDEELQKVYPILFDDPRTVFTIEPLDEYGNPDYSKNEYILGLDKTTLGEKVAFRAKKLLSVRIDKDGWYRASYNVVNERKESEWYVEEFYVSPELGITVDINVGQPVVYRDPDNELKSKLTVIVDYNSIDDEIDIEKSKLYISYDENEDGDFTNDGIHSEQFITNSDNNVLSYISSVEKIYTKDRATFNIYVDTPDKNFFGKFKFEFEAVEKPSIPNYDDLGIVPVMKADTYLLDDKKKNIFIDNMKPALYLETGTNKTAKVWILEDSNKPFSDADINLLIQELSLEKINVEIYIINSRTGTVRRYK